MMSSVTKIDWEDPAEAITGFMTFIIMALGYGISTGIGLGILTFVLVKLATGKVKEISVATWVLSVFFLATFLLT
jgi:AGZA family xanthine/uracil permease-like MFS transporter